MVPDPDGHLELPDAALPKVMAVIEVAAKLERGLAPESLLTVVRLMTALDDKGHRRAAAQLSVCLRASLAAMDRLGAFRNRTKMVSAAFDRFSDRRESPEAPRYDEPAPPKTVALKDLLPPGTLARNP